MYDTDAPTVYLTEISKPFIPHCFLLTVLQYIYFRQVQLRNLIFVVDMHEVLVANNSLFTMYIVNLGSLP